MYLRQYPDEPGFVSHGFEVLNEALMEPWAL